jgi:NADP-dependent 3-hydroxy acid dehydrogenase YdfG
MEDSQQKMAAAGKAQVVVTDVQDIESVQSLIDSAVQETGRLDMMVNNAGVSFSGIIIAGDPQAWRPC